MGHARPVANDRRMALGRRRDVLVAVVDHADRLLGLSRQQRGVQPDDRRELLLAAEPAAGLGLHHACCLIVEPEPALERGMEVVRALQRAGDGDAAAFGRDGDHRVVLDVELLLVPDPVLAFEDEVRGRERRIGVTAIDRVTGEDVVRGVGVEDGRQLGRPRRCPSACLAERCLVRCGDQRERLSVMLDLAADRHEDRLIGFDRGDDVVARDVVRGDDHDLRPIERGIEVEGLERSVGVGRSDRRAVPRTGDDDVVGIQRQPGQLLRPLATQRDRRARSTGDGRCGWDDERIGRARAGRHGPRRYHHDGASRRLGGSRDPAWRRCARPLGRRACR